jgi:molecular chaperone GrpE
MKQDQKQQPDNSSPNKGHLSDNFAAVPNQSPMHEANSQMEHGKGETTTQHTDKMEPDLKQIVEKLQQELTLANDKYLRLYAEFENFRRRTAQEKLMLMETAGEKILQEMLPIVDDFERALAALRQENVSVAAVEQGVELIHDKMMHLLVQSAVQAMKVEKGMPFNPDFHEAIAKTPVTDPTLRGKIVDIVEKGYLLKDKVLRYAKVIIGE